MFIIFIYFSNYFYQFFHELNIAKINGFKVTCVGKSSYSCMPIPLSFNRCLGLKMCVSFGNNPQNICVTFFTS